MTHLRSAIGWQSNTQEGSFCRSPSAAAIPSPPAISGFKWAQMEVKEPLWINQRWRGKENSFPLPFYEYLI